MPMTCEQCLFQGTKKEVEGKGMCTFCLVKGNWMHVAKKCTHFRENALDLTADLKDSLALDLRHEESENRRLKSIVKSTRFSMLIAFVIAFILFLAVTKFYDKFLF